MTAPGPPPYSPLPPPGSSVVGIDGVEVGRVAAVVPSPTGPPRWVTVTLTGTDTVVLAPLDGVQRTATGITAGLDSGTLRGAPQIAGNPASPTDADGAAASNYYRRHPIPPGSPETFQGDPPQRDAPQGDATGDLSPAMTDATVIRSREDLIVRTERSPYRHVRLRKRVITEEHTITVTLRREEFVLDECAAASGTPATGTPNPQRIDAHPGADQEVIEMTLYAERPVVSTEVVAVERIRARVVVVDGQPVDVTENVRHEEVTIERD